MRHAVDHMGLAGSLVISLYRPAAIVITSDKSSRSVAQQIVAGERREIRSMVHAAQVDRLAQMGAVEQSAPAHRHRRPVSVSGRLAAAARERGEHN